MATGTAAAPTRALSQKELDIQMMLAAEVHLGTKNCDFPMKRYVFKRRNDGIYIINLGKTWEKLQVAARVIVAIENPQDIIVQSAGLMVKELSSSLPIHWWCPAIAGSTLREAQHWMSILAVDKNGSTDAKRYSLRHKLDVLWTAEAAPPPISDVPAANFHPEQEWDAAAAPRQFAGAASTGWGE
ncbi:hypothetical protein GH714_018177 [Hevea brasiliensis]|uniref:40S ribosomal protein SA n=1 Tax=Hevea brasiliensis TaxID=3981 RepID=A0A6A6LKV5_HEVBR|nr:hypothetical protein GH714_018177 [Hevea brasiliensis]